MSVALGGHMGDAILIMFIGMGGVLLFLLVLIGLMSLLTFLCPQRQERLPQVTGPRADVDDDLIAVLQAAVLVYERDRRG